MYPVRWQRKLRFKLYQIIAISNSLLLRREGFMKKKIKYLFVSILMLMVFIMCYSRYMEPERLVVKEITVETDMDIENCRVVFFTDTHFGELYDEKHIEGIVTREEIFVTTKMWTDDFDNGAEAINASLERLGLDYIELMILHHSQPSNDVEAYQAMEQAVSEGKLRSIGLSNYYTPEDFDRLVNATSITPALLQNETHPYHQSMEMKEHLQQYGTVMESWFPLGGRGNTQTLFNDEVISGIAEAHGKTSAQIILRWHLQAGNIAIPGSSNEDHIQENIEIFDFALTDEEMEQMTGLDRNERFAGY